VSDDAATDREQRDPLQAFPNRHEPAPCMLMKM
jgi:hypothetical protein